MMKTYTEHIFEELIDNSTEEKLKRYLEMKRRKREEFERNRLHPKTREELQDMIVKAIEENGPEVDLNYIDVSGIEDMYSLFYQYYGDDEDKTKILRSFNGDISEWDVSSVESMHGMFAYAENFNQNISGWYVGSVKSMSFMFNCATSFNQDISDWDVSSVKNMSYMFWGAENFNQDISGWKVDSVDNFEKIFEECPIEEEYKPKKIQNKQ